jgi:molybdate transport system substrate-binding protein
MRIAGAVRGISLVIAMISIPASAADIRVFSGGAPQQVLQSLAPEFDRANGHRTQFTFAVVGAIQQRIEAGERPDLILLPVPLMNAIDKTVALRPESRAVLARVGIGVIVREGAARPDISTPEAVRTMLLAARKVALSEPSTPSGGHLVRQFAQLGIADAMTPKLVAKNAIDGGAALVANGEADLGLYLLSEVQTFKGTIVVGLLPAPVQSFVVYGTGIPAGSAAPEPGIALVKFVTDPARGERWKAGGFELVSAR